MKLWKHAKVLNMLAGIILLCLGQDTHMLYSSPQLGSTTAIP